MSRSTAAVWIVAVVVASLPVLRMAGLVLDARRLQAGDYWLMLPDLTTAGGGLDIDGIFRFHNGHLVVFAKILYWTNIQLFAGSNVALGLVVVAMVVAQLVLVVLLVRRTELGAVARGVTLVVAATLLFGMLGTWNFVYAMSGTAWLSANLFALWAVYQRASGRMVWAGLLALFATVSYGTGIAAWPAVIATGVVCRRESEGWRSTLREWPYAAGFVGSYLLYELGPVNSTSTDLWTVDVLKTSAAVLGFVFDFDDEILRVVGYFGLLAIPAVAAAVGLLARTRGVAGWVGVATYGWAATLVLGYGRAGYVSAFGLQNRYYSLPALGWLGLFVLTLLGAREVTNRRSGSPERARSSASGPVLAAVLAAIVLAGTAFAGRAHADTVTARDQRQELREISLRLGLADGTSYFFGLPWDRLGQITPRLEAMGHYPFVDDWEMGCGLVDRQLPPDAGESTIAGTVRRAPPPGDLRSAVELRGNFELAGDADCVLVADGSRQVVGVGTVDDEQGEALGDGDVRRYRYRGLARRSGAYTVFVVPEGGGPLLQVT